MTPTAISRETILAVDDSPVMRQLIQKTLSDRYRVLLADNATDALTVIYQEPAIALVLLDVSMPGIDGLELCRTVRSLPQFQQLPIVMLTGRDKAFDRVQGRLAGASEYLTKPFNASELQAVLDQWLHSSVSVEAS
jgi:twitching motility two-component system response regulator PilG